MPGEMYKRFCRELFGISRSSGSCRTELNIFNMKLVIVVALALVAAAAAAPQGAQAAQPVQILRSEFDQQPEGGYHFSYEADNGISRSENGEVKEALDEENKPHKVVIVRGEYSYPDEQGKPVKVTYFADETGYHAEGDTIPKPARR